jgi:hypothetical protein
MGFLTPAPPPMDVGTWKTKPHLEKIKPLAQDWAVNGFGSPHVLPLLYFVKLIVFAVGGFALIGATTPGLGGLGDFGDWWTEPIVWEKVVVFCVLWEFLGLGSGSGPLTFRFNPPIGGPLYWLRPGCMRLPPFPDHVPLTKGTTRTWFDVLLALGVYGGLGYLLFSNGEPITDPDALAIFGNVQAGQLAPEAVAVAIGFMVLLGLRDKVSFMQLRPDVFLPLFITFLFPLGNMVIASQLILFFVWIGAASSKLTHHFTYVVQAMVSNTPWNRSKFAKKQLYRDHPNSLQPSRQAHLTAHLGTVLEFAFPILLLIANGPPLLTIAVIVALVFHIHITSTFPLGVPLEWNLFMIFGIVWLWAEYGDVAWSTLDNPVLIAVIVLFGVVLPTIGRFFPERFSFLWSMLYYAGNWSTTWWLFRKQGEIEDRVDGEVVKSSGFAKTQITAMYDADTAEVTMYKGLAFRSMHSHGRALNGLLPRAVDDVEAYGVREGEFVAGPLLGWNFGDGHFHGAQLLAAVQERMNLDEGDIRVITLESQPTYRFRDAKQHYKLHDVRNGVFEEGYVRVKEMIAREPWLDESGTIPVEDVETRGAAQTPSDRAQAAG